MNRADPITVEVIKHSLAYASEEMGIAVRNSAYSPNIKERLDHSCALFDRRGRLIAQAEHIPVHLGSLPWGLSQTLAVIGTAGDSSRDGDMWIVNDPYLSGTHLNDITVVRPIFLDGNLIGYAANKAHHADVGGMVPGSMSADARDLFAEGLILPPMRLVRENAPVDGVIALVRANSRTPQARSGDLRAQMAGNFVGERRLLELYRRYGVETMEAAIDRALADSELRLRKAIAGLGDGQFAAEDFLEDAAGRASIALRVRLTLAGGRATFDYEGTHAQLEFPMNAVYGVTLSGVYYAIRAVTDPTIPMNEGCFRPIDVRVPEGSLLNPRRPAPVSGGNVETSSRNADLLLAVLAQAVPDRVPAASGGTMSNVMIGGSRSDGSAWSFYETNGCGMGARPNADGLHGIQCHMTNTLNTPIESLEREFPLRVTRYEFLDDSGGRGRFRGGDGLVRSLLLTEGTARVSLLAERHVLAPAGARGGESGRRGSHALIDGTGTTPLPAKVTRDFAPGETIEIRTPGGGGYGASGDG